MSALIFYAFTLGIAFSAPPGAVTAQAIQRGIVGGFRGVFSVQLGSLVGDAFWAILALAGLSILVQSVVVRVVIGLIGTLLLLKLAWSSLQQARQKEIPITADQANSARSDFMTGVLMSMTNPWAIAFWLGIGGAMAAAGISQPTGQDFITFLVCFMLGSAFWAVFISVVVAWGRRFVTPTFFRLINLICGLGLGFFGLKLLVGIISLLTA